MRRMHGWCVKALIAGSCVCVVTGCKPSAAVKHAGEIESGGSPVTPAKTAASVPAASTIDRTTLGTIGGTVRFAGKPPDRVKIDMSMDPACAMAGGDNYSEQYVVHDGKLANVYVYLKSGPAAAMNATVPSPAPVVMDQVGCRYTPHVIAVMAGGTVEFRNSDGTMHNIHTMPTMTGVEPIDVSQGAKGAPVTKTFGTPEVMMPVRCNNHPWMNAFVNVSATPFYAVSDADGHFAISGLPAGTYTVAAVHEKMGEQDITVTVTPQATAKADFSFSVK